MQIYGQPWLQIMAGLGASEARVLPNPGAQPEHRRFISQRKQEVHASIERGNSHHAVMRALIFVLGGAPTTDERNFQSLKATRAEVEPNIDLTSFKALVRDQFFILKHDSHAALEALPVLLAGESAEAIDGHFAHIEQVVSARGTLDEKSRSRLMLVRKLFDKAKPQAKEEKGTSGSVGPAEPKALQETAPESRAAEQGEPTAAATQSERQAEPPTASKETAKPEHRTPSQRRKKRRTPPSGSSSS